MFKLHYQLRYLHIELQPIEAYGGKNNTVYFIKPFIYKANIILEIIEISRKINVKQK